MNGLVLYAEDYKKAYEVKKHFEKIRGYDFFIKHIDALETIPKNTAYIATEWNVRMDLYHLLQKCDARLGIAFYNDAFLSDIDDTKSIDLALEEAIQNKNWEICKGINLFYLMGDIIRKRNCLKSMPVKLQIETTDLCNARCIMCSHSYNSGTGISILKSGIFERIESILPFIKVVILHGNGEPFLEDDITIYLERMRSYGISFISNTNLSIVTDKLIDFFNDSFWELTVSCDGHTKELYESIRKGLSFENFLKNVKRVRKQCPDLNMKMSVVVMRQNLAFLAEIVEFAASHGFNEIILNQLCMDEKNDNLKDAAYLYPDELLRYTSDAIERGRLCNIRVVVPYAFEKSPRSEFQGKKIAGECIGVCDWLMECPYIDLRGNVAPCCIKQKEYLGIIFKTDFHHVWNGDRYIQAREEFRKGKIPNTCSGCDFAVQGRLQYLLMQNNELKMLEKKSRC